MSYTPPPPPPPGPGGYAYPAPRTSGKAVASLVSGIVGLPLSLCCSLFAGIPAIVLGFMARSEIRNSRGAVTGDGLAIAGLILGFITVILAVAGVVLLLATGSLSDYYDSTYP